MTDIDYATATATDLVQALRARQVSALELAETAIARIEAMDGVINAVVVRDFDHARDQARAADRKLAAGEAGALLGLPMTVKETYDLTGFPTTYGVEANLHHRATRDAAAVQRLKQAGAVILGKTNVPVNAADWESVNPIYGRTLNPLDHARSPGGSSGGSAAALAAGYTSLEIGSDIGGSIRIPAAFCGVYGQKTSYGIVPTTGHAPGGFQPAKPLLNVCGPLARSAGDLALAMSVLVGPDGEDAKAYSISLPPPRRDSLAGYRVLVLTEHPKCTTGSDVGQAIERLAGRLAQEGAEVAYASEGLPDLAAGFALYLPLLLTQMSRRTGNSDGRPPISSHEWLALLDQQARVRREWAAFFEDFDVVLAPSFPTCAIPHQPQVPWSQRSLIIDGEATPYGDGLAWQSVALLPNLPATAMPIGPGVEGLPLSAQVIGPYLEDRTTIRFAELASRLV